MKSERIKLEVSNEESLVAYLSLPKHPKKLSME